MVRVKEQDEPVGRRVEPVKVVNEHRVERRPDLGEGRLGLCELPCVGAVHEGQVRSSVIMPVTMVPNRCAE